MKRTSLGLRLGLLALTSSLIVLIVIGMAIAGLLRNFVVETYETNLNATLVALMANTQLETDIGRISVNVSVADPRYEQPFSGWYWQIADRDTVLVRSGSLWTQSLAAPVDGVMGTGPEGEALHILSRSYTAPGGTTRLLATAAMPQAQIEADIAAIVRPLAISLGLLALGLAAAIVVQIRFGLRPLRELSGQLRAIRQGNRDRLDPVPYAEIAPVVSELNTLLDTNAKTIERARTHVGNLAHGLKTPLAILATESADPAMPEAKRTTLSELSDRMSRLVSHHLRRARTAATLGVAGARTPVAEIVSDLEPVFAGVYADKGLSLSAEIDPGLAFAGERQDLEELLGNLIDNACKWADSAVSVAARRMDAETLEITVCDDGHGMSAHEARTAIQWGKRFDEGRPGAGLGLAIVADLAALYGGTLTLKPHGEAPMTGACAVLRLPSAP